MLFCRFSVFKILLSFLLVINFPTFTGLAEAQSFLSDRDWFEKISEKELFEENSCARFSCMMHGPLVLQKSIIRSYAPEKPKLLYSIKLPSKPFKSTIQSDDLKKKSSIPFLSRIYKSVPGMKLPNADTGIDRNEQDQEWVNNEFAGFSVLVDEIEEMIFFDPEAAREKYLKFEEWLKIEDRVRLKVQLLYHLNQWASAEKLANTFLKERPRSSIIPLIYYYLNKSLLSQKKPLDQNQIYRELALKELNPKRRSDLLLIFSDEAQLKGEILTAIQYRLKQFSNPETLDDVDLEKTALMIKGIKSLEELRILLVNYPDSEWLQDQIFDIDFEIFSKQRRYSNF